jgi:hypothetical protein
VGQEGLRIAFITLVTAAIAACAVAGPSAAPRVVQGPVPTAVPNPAATATSSHGRAATLTFVNIGGSIDGPGESVSQAIANVGALHGHADLVNGIFLRTADGTLWLCEHLLESSPQECAEPSLLVENWLPGAEDVTFLEGDSLHIAGGVRWVERMQLLGVVRPEGPGPSP